LWQRLDATLTQPFLNQPQYYELSGWRNLISDQIEFYQASPFAGWNPGVVGNAILTMLAGIGLGVLAYEGRNIQPAGWVMLSWIGVTLVETLTIPLNWQRYYLPLILVTVVLSAMGGEFVLSAIRQWQSSRLAITREERQAQETLIHELPN
jgi:hypothetical protein